MFNHRQQQISSSNTSPLTSLQTAQLIASVSINAGLNQPYNVPYIQQQLLQKGITPNQVVTWVSHLRKQFGEFGLVSNSHGVSDAAVPDYVTGALQTNIDYLINSFRVQSATHVSFSSGAAQILGYQTVLTTINNPQMPLVYKKQLSNALLIQVNTTLTGLASGANKLLTAIDGLSSSSNLDMTTLTQASNSLLSQASGFVDQLSILDENTALSDISELLTTGLGTVSNALQNTNLISQNVQTVAQFMLDKITSIPTAQLSQYDETIVSLSNQLNELKLTGSADDLINNVATQLQSAINNKISAGEDVVSAFSDVSDVGNFLGTVGDVIGVPELQQIGGVVSSVIQIGEGIAALAAPAVGVLAFAFPVGTVAAIAIGVGTLISSIFGNRGPDENQQLSKQIGQLSQQVQSVGIYLGTAINQLGQYDAGQFKQLDAMVSEVNQNLETGFNALSQSIQNLQVNLDGLIQNTDRLVTTGFTDLSNMLDSLNQNIMQQFMQTQGQVSEVVALTTTINAQLDALTATVTNGFTQLYSQQYENLLTEFINYYQDQIYGQAPGLNPTAATQAFLSIINWISVDTKNPVFHGDLAGQYNLAALNNIPKTNVSNVLNYINLLKGFLTSPQGYGLTITPKKLPANMSRAFIPSANAPCSVLPDTSRYVNPQVWTNMAQNLMQYITQTPELELTSGSRCSIQQVVQSGEDFLEFILALKTNTGLFERLMDDYQSVFDELVVAVYQEMVQVLKLKPEDIQTALQQGLEQQINQLPSMVNELNNLFAVVDPTCGSEHKMFCCCPNSGSGTIDQNCNGVGANPIGSGHIYSDTVSISSISCNTLAFSYNGRMDKYPYASLNMYYVNIQALPSTYCNNLNAITQLNQVTTSLSVASNQAVSFLSKIPLYSNASNQHWFSTLNGLINAYQSTFSQLTINMPSFFSQFDTINTCSVIQWNSLPEVSNGFGYTCISGWYYANGAEVREWGLSDSQTYIPCSASSTSISAPPAVQLTTDKFSGFNAIYQQVKSTYNTFSSNHQNNPQLFYAVNQTIQTLKAQISHAADLQTDTLYYSSANTATLSTPALAAMLQWLTKDSTLTTRQQIQTAILKNINNAGIFQTLINNLNERRQALVLFMTLAFNEQFNGLDPLARQQVLALMTGDDFLAMVQADQTLPYNSIIQQLNNALFPAAFSSSINSDATKNPTGQPSRQPTGQPSAWPTAKRKPIAPTGQPSKQPTGQPSGQPTEKPNRHPTGQPSRRPSGQPSTRPTSQPSMQPTKKPSRQPTGQPSIQPTAQPSRQPTNRPSSQPSRRLTREPSRQPTGQPTGQPSRQPSGQPSRQPTGRPSRQPTGQPSRRPTGHPSGRPTDQPSKQPTGQPTRQPTGRPSRQPTGQPSRHPTGQPSRQPTGQPSRQPTGQPSKSPTAAPSSLAPIDSIITMTRDYIVSATAMGKALYQQGILDPGYWSLNAILSQLRDMRDYVLPQGLSALQVTPQMIANAYIQNTTATISTLNTMLFNMDLPDNDGNTAVMLAVKACHIAAVQSLINRGVQLNILNAAYQSVLNFALNCQNAKQRRSMLTLLIQNNATYCEPTDVLLNALASLYRNNPSVPIASVECIDFPEGSLSTITPISAPTTAPSHAPSNTPSIIPSTASTTSPTYLPSNTPVVSLTSNPNALPTHKPTFSPTTSKPIETPTQNPSINPTTSPTDTPTAPTTEPTSVFSNTPITMPTLNPSTLPTHKPTPSPTTSSPTETPISLPTIMPAILPTSEPTLVVATASPTSQPTLNNHKQHLRGSNSQELASNSMIGIIVGSTLATTLCVGIVTAFLIRQEHQKRLAETLPQPSLDLNQIGLLFDEDGKFVITSGLQARRAIVAAIVYLNAHPTEAHETMSPSRVPPPSTVCFYRWRNNLGALLPTINNDSQLLINNDFSLMRSCEPQENYVAWSFFSDTKIKLIEKTSGRIGWDITIGENDTRYLQKSARGFLQGFMMGVTEHSLTTTLKQLGISSKKTEAMLHLVHGVLLWAIYGQMSLLLQLLSLALKHERLGMKDSTIRLISVFLSAAFFFSQIERLDTKGIASVALQTALPVTGSILGKTAGEKIVSMFFTKKTQAYVCQETSLAGDCKKIHEF